MGTKVKAPQPSSAEMSLQTAQADLLKQQSDILKQQQQQQSILLPFLGEQMGFSIQTDEHGNITGISETDTEGKERRGEIQKLEEEKSLAALKGDLPVDPNLESSIQNQEQTLRERLERQFGPGYETSSGGIETLGDFFQSAEGLRYGARTGQLTLSEQLSLARQQSGLATGAQGVSTLQGTTFGQSLGLAGAFGQAAGGYGAAQQPYQFNRTMQYNANAANAETNASLWTGAAKLAGAAAFSPMAGTAAGTLFSDEALKENIIKIGSSGWGPGIYVYNLKGDPTPRVGMMAGEVAIVRPDAIGEREGYLTVDYGAL